MRENVIGYAPVRKYALLFYLLWLWWKWRFLSESSVFDVCGVMSRCVRAEEDRE